MTDAPYNVLFLCTGNSARSIIAEAMLNRMGRGRFKAFSAGAFPEGGINPHAAPIIEHLGFRPSDFRCKSWDEFAGPDAPPLDFVFTVSDEAGGEVCPTWPGSPITGHWGLPDPAAVKGSEAEIAWAFGETARQLRNRIQLFVALPFDKLDRLSLQSRVSEIGAAAEEPAH
jgi:arsenate reductase